MRGDAAFTRKLTSPFCSAYLPTYDPTRITPSEGARQTVDWVSDAISQWLEAKHTDEANVVTRALIILSFS